MKYKYIAAALLVAIGFLPLYQATAQSSATTRAQQILDRNAERQVEIENRNVDYLLEVNVRMRESYQDRIVPQIDAFSADARATILPITTVLDNISDRLENVMVVMDDIGIPLNGPGAFGVVAYDVEEKFENFLNCYDGSGATPSCVVYELPASDVEVDPAGLQPLAPQPASASLSFVNRLDIISPGGTATTAGVGYATGGSGATAPFTTPFAAAYNQLRDDAKVSIPASFQPQYGISQNMINAIQSWPNNVYCDPASTMFCEFTSPEVFNTAVAVQVAKLRNDLAYLEGALINVRQSVRAFVFDVQQATEAYRQTLDSYDPTGGEDSFSPQDRQGAR